MTSHRSPLSPRRALAAAAGAIALLAAPASAAAQSDGRLHDLLRAKLDRTGAAAASVGERPLPVSPPARAARAAVAARRRPARVVVGLRSARDAAVLAPRLRRLAGSVERVAGLPALVVRAPSPARLARALAGDPHVAYLELDRGRRLLAEPFDTVDPETGLPYTWAYDFVRAGEAIASVGGGSSFPVAVLDSGLDHQHPDLAAQVRSLNDAVDGVSTEDRVGHGTFVAGLVAMIEGNGIGGRGVAGRTPIMGVRVGDESGALSSDVARGIAWATRNGGRIVNLSLGSPGITQIELDALEFAFLRDVLPVAASGNEGDEDNRASFPAAAIGGRSGRTGIGLSVGALRPDGSVASFSTHNRAVSVAAPGAAQSGCRHGVFSTLPSNHALLWDDPAACSRIFNPPEGRYAYGQGTSFSSPVAAGAAALAWQAERRLASEQVADVINRSANGTGWDEFRGNGWVDAMAAVALARIYDITDPRASFSARRRGGSRVRASVSGRDRTLPGNELAGRVTTTLYRSRDRRNWTRVAGPRRGSLTRPFALNARRLYLQALICDRNENCRILTRGPFRRR